MDTIVRSFAVLFLTLLFAGPAPAQEPIARAAEAREEGVAKPGGRKAKREAPSRMVLCRGPRGAVYARDASAGCRNTTLSPANLVGFGAGKERGCVIQPKPKLTQGQTAPATCAEVCQTADGARCVVALRAVVGEAWHPSSPDAPFEKDEEVLSVCCQP